VIIAIGDSVTEDLFFLKFGGSLITDKNKPFTERKDVIKRLTEEIHIVKEKYDIKLIVGHGSGSYPHVPASKYETHKGIISDNSYRGIAEVQDAASRLNRIIVRALIDAGENAVSINPSSVCIAKNSRIVEFYTETLDKLLKHGMLPVVYGDVALDLEQGCCILSTEEIMNFLARKMAPKKIIMTGLVDGVFTTDPQKTPDAKLIPKITPKNYSDVKKMLTGSHGIDVTGGMAHKVERMLELLSETGVVTQIISGVIEGNIIKVFNNENIGTIIGGE